MSLVRLFAMFVRFGALAWGGPVAQIDMLRHELVERRGWVDEERFGRVLGVYQALPGPEATELCVYFGMTRRGRIGGLVAGVGFMLPGAALMLCVAWAYVATDIVTSSPAAVVLAGLQLGGLALVVRGAGRLAHRSLRAPWLWAIALAVLALSLWMSPPERGEWSPALAPAAGVVGDADAHRLADDATGEDAGLPHLATTGLVAGSASFGGAYTTVPFIEDAAVRDHGWITRAQLLEGLAIGAALPAPFIIYATFVGFLAAGLAGAVVITVAIFAPAFVITLLGHGTLERLVDTPSLHRALDAVTAAVIGLILATSVSLAAAAVTSWVAVAACAAALALLGLWRARPAIVGALAAAVAVVGISQLAG